MPISIFILLSCAFSFLVDPVPFLSFFFRCIPFHWHLTLLARALVSDVCFLSIYVMYIDVVPDEVICTVN